MRKSNTSLLTNDIITGFAFKPVLKGTTMKWLWIWLSVCSFLISVSVCQKCIKQNACRCVLTNGTAIDLTEVGRKDVPRFFEVLNHESDDRLSYDPCYPFSYPAKYHQVEVGAKPCVDVAACAVTSGSEGGQLPTEKSLGSHDTAIFHMDKTQLYIFYPTIINSTQITLVVQIVCSGPETEHRLDIINETSMILTSKCACPGSCQKQEPDTPPKQKLSTGSILLITFFVIILCYIGLGILWNFCNGAQGVELLPNIEFWSDFPKLIMDGCLFTCSCFGRRQSYGEVVP